MKKAKFISNEVFKEVLFDIESFDEEANDGAGVAVLSCKGIERMVVPNANIELIILEYSEEILEPYEEAEVVSNAGYVKEEQEETLYEIGTPILISFKTFLGKGIDKTDYIKCINAANESNRNEGYPYQFDENGLLAAHVEFWEQIYDIVIRQGIRSVDGIKVGFKQRK